MIRVTIIPLATLKNNTNEQNAHTQWRIHKLHTDKKSSQQT